MSLDLFQQEANDRLTALPPVQNVDPGMWDGFIRGTGMATMKGFAKAARAVDLLGAVVPIAQDTFTGGTEAQDKYFAGHDAIFGRAVDYWTPKPQEVGMAGEVMGSLISLIPFVAFQPTQPLAIAATQLGTAEDLVNAGVTSGKANVVGAVQGATLATGIWMPILGKNLWQRAVIGGAGFNLVQGTAARAVSGAILADTPAKDMFKAFDAEAMTLDVLMGLAFGGLVHLSPTQRAQGAAAWDKIESWAKNLNPSDKAAIATLREAQHLNVDSTPGKPVGTPDIEAHVERMRAAIDQLATDQPVNVEDIKKETGVPPIRTIGVPIRIEGNDPKTVTYSRLDDGRLERTITYDDGDTQTAQLANKANGDEVWVSKEGYERGNFFLKQLDEGEAAKAAAEDAESMGAPRIERQPEAPRFEPDPERTAQAEATARDLQAAAETVRAEEGIPPPPRRDDYTAAEGGLATVREAQDRQAYVAGAAQFLAEMPEGGRFDDGLGGVWTVTRKTSVAGTESVTAHGETNTEIISIQRRPGGEWKFLGDWEGAIHKDTSILPAQDPPGGNQPRFEPDPARTAQAEATVRDLQAAAETVRAEEGIPPPPQEPPRVVQSVRRTIEEELSRAGRPAEEAAAGAAIWDAFYTTMAKRIGTTVEDLWSRFPLARITNEMPGGQALKQGPGGEQVITVGGKDRPITNSDGRRIAADIEELKAFWNWFKDSKVIAADGKPQTMFHGTASDFKDSTPSGSPFWLAYEAPTAKKYADRAAFDEVNSRDGNEDDSIEIDEYNPKYHGIVDGGAQNILPVYAKAVNPLDLRDLGESSSAEAVFNELQRRGIIGKDENVDDAVDFMDNPDATSVYKILEELGVYDDIKRKGHDAVIISDVDTTGHAHDSLGVFEPTQIKSAIGNRGTFDPKNPDILYQDKENTWYKSALGEAIDKLNMKQGDAKAWLQALKGLGNKGVKAEEVKWSGIEEWLQLQEGKITKEQVQEFLANNGVKVEEVMLGERPNTLPDDWAVQEKTDELEALGWTSPWIVTEKNGTVVGQGSSREAAIADALQSRSADLEATPTKYGTYQLPGGENYRELLLTLPPKPAAFDQAKYDELRQQLAATVDRVAETRKKLEESGDPKYQDEMRELSHQRNAIADQMTSMEIDRDNARKQTTFNSSHFDQPNILAHIRFNERTDAEGKKVLFIEEFQSDWAQRGKRRGFAGQGEETAPPVRQLEAMSGQWTYGNELTRPGTNTTGTITQWEGTGWADNGRDFPEGGRGYRATFQNQRATFDTFEAAEAWLVDAMAPIIQSLANGAKVGKIPAAPFVQKTDAWVGLTLKRMIAYAAENGFDRVAWTRGEQQVERYTGALRKAVDVIEWTKTDKGVQLVGYKGTADNRQMAEMRTALRQIDDEINTLLGNRSVAELTQAEQQHLDNMQARRDDLVERLKPRNKVVDTTEKEDALSDAIGKAMAEKIISDPNQSGTIEGENIRIDSTGMAGFYDRIVPKVANEVLKKLGGGKVADVDFIKNEAPAGWDVAETTPGEGPTTQQGFDITQSMKDKVEGGLPLFQKTKGTERGYMSIGDEGRVIGLLEGADASTFIHESGHFFLDTMAEIGKLPDVPAAVRADLDTALTWMGLKDPAKWVDMTLDEKRPYHEKYARGFEQYLREGKAPSDELKGVFQRFRDWLVELYKSAKSLNVKLNDDIRGVMNRMLADQTRNPSTEAPPAPSVRPGSPPPPGVDGEAQAGAEAQMRAMLQDMALNETGWAQEGGKLLDRNELGTGKPSFTTWIPKAEWWPGRPDKKLNAAKVQEAVRKYLAGEKLKPGEQRTVDYMIDIANARNKGIDTVGGMEEYKALAEEAWDEGLDPTTENVVDLDLVARAAAIDEAYVERAALKYENDDAAFRGELEMLIYETERAQATEAAGRSKAGEQKKAGSQGAEGQKPTDIVRAEADLIVEKNPEMPITVGVNPDGTPMTMTAREFLDQARAEAELNRADIPLLEVAAQCLLGMS